MKQVLESLKTGLVSVVEVPRPQVRAGSVLGRTRTSLISAGTERMLIEFGQASWWGKARREPERVRRVFEKMRTDGVAATLEAVQAKLDREIPLGYANVAVVEESGCAEFRVGDRVVSNGVHAEFVTVAKNLCARVPDGVTDEAASFTVLGAIALEGVRRAGPQLGEVFCVCGLGPIGLLAVQLLRANGCRVLATDLSRERLELAAGFGAETFDLRSGVDPVMAARAATGGRGVDGVLVCTATSSSAPVRQAAQMSRQRGRVVLVGVAGMELDRSDFYKSEVRLEVSCSYGPGRYDAQYEERGQDYPFAHVRWTAQRNFEAVLGLMASGALDVRPLVSHRFAVERAEEAYAVLTGGGPSLGILLEYAGAAQADATVWLERSQSVRTSGNGTGVGFIGAGNYAVKALLPALVATGAQLHTIVSREGVSAAQAGRRFGFARASSDMDAVLTDATVGTVFIATPHESHAELVLEALAAGKHVFVEKPLATKLEDVRRIGMAVGAGQRLGVGFNRRFAPLAGELKRQLAGLSGPKAMVMTVNAGAAAAGHWSGRDRLIGEGCHFVDFLRFLAGARIGRARCSRVLGGGVMGLEFEDGSVGTVNYLTEGHRSVAKERLEVFCGGRVLELDNFRQLRVHGGAGSRRLWRQDKGNAVLVAEFMKAVCDPAVADPIALEELLEVSRVVIEAAGG